MKPRCFLLRTSPRQTSLLLGQGTVPRPCSHHHHLGSWAAQQPGPRQASLLLGQGIVPCPHSHHRHRGSWDAQQPKSCLELTGVVEITRRPREGGVRSLMEGADLAQTVPGAHGEKGCARSSSASTTHRPTTQRAFTVEREDERERAGSSCTSWEGNGERFGNARPRRWGLLQRSAGSARESLCSPN